VFLNKTNYNLKTVSISESYHNSSMALPTDGTYGARPIINEQRTL